MYGADFEHRRWFSGKGRQIDLVREIDSAPVPSSDCSLLLTEVIYVDGSAERYLVVRDAAGAEPEVGSGAWAAICQLLLSGKSIPGLAGGSFVGEAGGEDSIVAQRVPGRERVLGGDQSNTLVVIDDVIVLKLYRKLSSGIHPEAELLSALTGSGLVPALAGSLSYVGRDGQACSLALGMEYIKSGDSGIEEPIRRLVELLEGGGRASETWAATDEFAAAASVTGRLHSDLSRAFGVKSATRADLAAWRRRAHRWLEEALGFEQAEISDALAPRAEQIGDVLQRIEAISPPNLTRVHGDLHIWQFLASDRGPVVIDFEGDPLLPLADRRRLDTPMRDLASLLRSVDHVASAAGTQVFGDPLHPDLEAWLALARSRVLDAYRGSPAATSFEPDAELLFALEVAKECAEFVYAARYLPDWSYAPAAGMHRLLGPPRATAFGARRS